jgi:hypothetical protein
MTVLAKYRQRLAAVGAFVVPLGVAAVLVPFRTSFANTAAALVLVAFIFAVAVVGNRFAGVVASVSSALWFDFFLTRPYDRFAISHRPDIETTISLLVVGVMVSELAARSRHHSRASSEESDFVAKIRDLTEQAAGSTPIASVVASASSSLVDLLYLRGCRFETVASEPPLARIQSDGEVVHVGLGWPVGDLGIPGPEAEILTEWRGLVLGRFVLTPTPGRPVPVERRVVAVALARVVAATLNEQRRVL